MLRRGLHGACRRRLLDGTMGRTHKEQGQVHYPRREARGETTTQERPCPIWSIFRCGRVGVIFRGNKRTERSRDTYEAV